MNAPKAYLIKIEADGIEGDRWEISAKPLIIGRSKEAAVLLLSRKVSRMHCAVMRQKNGDYSVEDLLSTNGTWVNGQRLEVPAVLQPYDRIGVGEARFVFKLH